MLNLQNRQQNRIKQPQFQSLQQNQSQKNYSSSKSQRNIAQDYFDENLSVESEKTEKQLRQNFKLEDYIPQYDEAEEIKKQIQKMLGDKVEFKNQIIQLQEQNSEYQETIQELNQRLKSLKIQNQDLKFKYYAKEQAQNKLIHQHFASYSQRSIEKNFSYQRNKNLEKEGILSSVQKQINQIQGKKPVFSSAVSQKSFRYAKPQGQLDLSPIIELMKEQEINPPVIYIDFSYVFPKETI